MPDQPTQAREDQFLGALLGLAIGDALGRPLAGLTAEEIQTRHGKVTSYLPLEDVADGPAQGEITAITEIILCMVESMTTNGGMIEPENINARLAFLARGPSRDWMSEAVLSGIERAGDGDGLVGDDAAAESELAVAIRGVPVGLLHAVGGYDETAMAQDATLAARLTHGGDRQSRLVLRVGEIMMSAARFREVPIPGTEGEDGHVETLIADVVRLVQDASTFEDAIAFGIGLGGRTNEIGALAGAIAGGSAGASGIPQDLIDGLDARIYLSLAAPWFYRAAVRRAGTVIDLRVVR